MSHGHSRPVYSTGTGRLCPTCGWPDRDCKCSSAFARDEPVPTRVVAKLVPQGPRGWVETQVRRGPGGRRGHRRGEGTRLPVATVFENFEDLSLDEVMEQFEVSRDKVTAVLEFVAESLRSEALPVLVLFDPGTPKGLAQALSVQRARVRESDSGSSVNPRLH
jgi:uncharacterized protein (DUF433 family)